MCCRCSSSPRRRSQPGAFKSALRWLELSDALLILLTDAFQIARVLPGTLSEVLAVDLQLALSSHLSLAQAQRCAFDVPHGRVPDCSRVRHTPSAPDVNPGVAIGVQPELHPFLRDAPPEPAWFSSASSIPAAPGIQVKKQQLLGLSQKPVLLVGNVIVLWMCHPWECSRSIRRFFL